MCRTWRTMCNVVCRKADLADTTSRNLIQCAYDTSRGTGGTKPSNRKTMTSGNFIAGFYCISYSRQANSDI